MSSTQEEQEIMTVPKAGVMPPEGPIRPVGAWIVAGVVTVAILSIWILVSLIFLHRT